MYTDEFGTITEVFMHVGIHMAFLKLRLYTKHLVKTTRLHKDNTNLMNVYGEIVWKSAWFHSALSPEVSTGRDRLFVYLCGRGRFTQNCDSFPPKVCFVLREHMARQILF